MAFSNLDGRKLTGQLIVDGHNITQLMGSCDVVLADRDTGEVLVRLHVEGGKQAPLAKSSQVCGHENGDVCGNCKKHSKNITYIGDVVSGVLALCPVCLADGPAVSKVDAAFLKGMNIKWD